MLQSLKFTHNKRVRVCFVWLPCQDAADELAESLAGMGMGPLCIGKPEGPLKGVAAPAGKHLVFDDDGMPKETPASKLRQAPRHTYFDDEGRPIQAPAARPVWR